MIKSNYFIKDSQSKLSEHHRRGLLPPVDAAVLTQALESPFCIRGLSAKPLYYKMRLQAYFHFVNRTAVVQIMRFSMSFCRIS
jgi:hypothetical protein